MGFADIRTKIIAQLVDNWTTTDIAYDNRHYEPTEGEAYIRVTIFESNTDQVSLGSSPRERTTGFVDIGIFVPVNSGDLTARQYADTIADIFRRVQIGTLQFQTPTARRIGESDGCFQYNVTAPFYYNEISN